MKNDTRYCYGATCTWHGPIQHTSNSGGILGCPYCGGPLYQMSSKTQWDKNAEDFKNTNKLDHYLKWLEAMNEYGCIPLNGWDWEKDYNKFVEKLNEPRRKNP